MFQVRGRNTQVSGPESASIRVVSVWNEAAVGWNGAAAVSVYVKI